MYKERTKKRRRKRSGLRVLDPGLDSPCRGRKTWIRGGLFFFCEAREPFSCIRDRIYVHSCTHTWTRTEKAGDDEWMTGQWAWSDARECFMTIQYVRRERTAALGCTFNAPTGTYGNLSEIYGRLEFLPPCAQRFRHGRHGFWQND